MRIPKTHCANGHEFTPENTYIYLTDNGKEYRKCRTCSLRNGKMRQLRQANGKKPTERDSFLFYVVGAKQGCIHAKKKTGYTVRCLDCPLPECVYVLKDIKDYRVKSEATV
jgi:hypothetical protein